MLSDIEIAQNASLRPLADSAAELGIPAAAFDSYGRYIVGLS